MFVPEIFRFNASFHVSRSMLMVNVVTRVKVNVSLTPVVHIVTETGDQESETGEGAEVLPPARVDKTAVHHLEHHHHHHCHHQSYHHSYLRHCKGMSPVVVNNLE